MNISNFYKHLKLPVASNDRLGTVKVGENLSITNDGLLKSTNTVPYSNYAEQLLHPFALTLTGDVSGTASITGNTSVNLSTTANYPIASGSTFGLVKIGNNINVQNGVISVTFPETQDFTITNEVKQNSNSLVRSGGVYTALLGKIDKPQNTASVE